MNNGRRVILMGPRAVLLTKEFVIATCHVDGYVNAVTRDRIAFSPLQLHVMTRFSGGGEWIDIKAWLFARIAL